MIWRYSRLAEMLDMGRVGFIFIGSLRLETN